ncbi:hypothetical protein GQ41_2020 [Arenibacter algicola]|jgi:hypothetical protein|uniref:Uncharacterized protein n=3 Tax=Arenibacter TaxID=178469 RepID=A0A221UZC2_9FLAO|nr:MULTISPECIES: hypothetical protein [Arenibacter]HCO84345.1 hypothetical protein [Arenibacter sp.]ASO06613.1 hypothetical protein AREALGSMS7_03186 [Arenibacter algicola]MBU2904257.1 hypothetical protein [Arenibacter algicola]MCK0134733.1 hypothetical protein [Arenibacter sp. S6351L]MCK0191532.1 hypothetical protein [Arenibacter sp. F20364]|tara:strand:- start:249 stop:455 length:207 start_codon:yes stop_codon:yes gene_type:complete
MGRPATKPTELKDGYYIEVRNRNQKTGGIKIRRDTEEQMLLALEEYKKSKDVTVLGELKNGKMLDLAG